jgi:hypothetical protein
MAAVSLLAANLPGTMAEAKDRPHHRRYVLKRFDRLPHPDLGGQRRMADGDLVDRNGWRLRDGQWDNTCFNLGYLSSQFACAQNGGEGG